MIRRPFALPVACVLLSALAACSGSSGGSAPADARLLVTATTDVLEPAAGSAPVIDLSALGADRVDSHYRLTTPADAAFRFELVSWATNAWGGAYVAVQHLRDGGDEVGPDGLSLARAGLLPLGAALFFDGQRTLATGDGFVRLTIQGRITRDQLLAVQSEGGGVVLVEVAIGAPSAINRLPAGEPELVGVVSRDVVYSSKSWNFGMPTVAVSGDRTSVVCYEGDREDPNGPARYELRLQHAAASGAVTGGATAETAADNGYWRDHEIVALYNVLGVVRSETEGVRVRLSFDRGATFGQDVQVLSGFTQSRLVQAAMAADYSLAIAAWRAREQGGQEFVLVEGRATAFDAGGSPTWFQFTPAQVLYTTELDATPLTTGIAWSAGGDLVVGYGTSWLMPRVEAPGWVSTTTFRCATRPYGGAFRDLEVDREELFAMDPSVAVLGQGEALRVFYAYEVRGGIRLAVSEDAGATFAPPVEFGQRGDLLPTVFARDDAGQTRVDVLYLANREAGTEIHRSRWLAWPNSPREDQALTRARLEQVPFSGPTGGGAPPFPHALRVTQIHGLGYDAVLDGEQIVVAYDEVTLDNVYVCYAMGGSATTVSGGLPPIFQPASPPPLAPGLTQPLPAPDPEHAHQLKLLRIL